MRYSKEERAMWLEDWRQSEKSAWVYAKENGLNPQTFVNWTKTKPEGHRTLEEAGMSFVEIPTQVMAYPVQAQEILIEKGAVKIHIPLVLGRAELRAVMEGLGCAL